MKPAPLGGGMPTDNREVIVINLPRAERRKMAAEQRRAKKRIAKCPHRRTAERQGRTYCVACGVAR